ncbi:MAG TPA: hypothetical protein VLQ29_00230 [Candidatus Dormibacteraeota bacterium]|nr:hypothetical protein [Candidatus Dormibacteraeota bacterium]
MKPRRSKRRKSATKKPAASIRKWSVEEPEAILDYLHGDIPRDEAKPCCYYEYARTSKIFQRARNEYDSVNAGDAVNRVTGKFPLFRDDWQKLEILICHGYPTSPWRDLSEAQRKDIAKHFVKTRPPLLIPIMTQSFILNSIGIFDRFKEQAASDASAWKKHSGQYFPAIVGDNGIKYLVLLFDYGQGKDAMKKAFSLWLDSEANKKLFKKYYKKPIHKQNPDSPDRYKELLKYLAAWRLYSELGFKAATEWTAKNRRRENYHARLFFRERLRKTPSGMHYKGPIFKERRQWEDAITKAKSFLATEIERGSGLT